MNNPIREDDPRVLSLSKGKKRLSVRGRISVYQLSNGWIARRREPENGWARQSVWSIYSTPALFDSNQSIGGGEGRLTRAIVNTINAQQP